ncbi:F0F1 ATP synthase subunit beta, partial [Burkholderia pseudomallei]|nr:F0F1 ATP synthase subunit beta [Burkholderia pseudomallei]MBF3604773.1 F0F1 ATP synthase subunit beta [Burkholderia pseudomallei]
CDDWRESSLYMVGTLDDARRKEAAAREADARREAAAAASGAGPGTTSDPASGSAEPQGARHGR